MKKYHTGYYLNIGNSSVSPDEYSKKFIKDTKLQLIPDNYKGLNWHVDWIYSEYWNGLEFIIEADSPEAVQNVLFNVLCSAAVIEGNVSWSSDAHYPHEFGTLKKEEGIDILENPIKGFCNFSIPYYFFLAVLASKDNYLENAIVKYHLSTEIYSKDLMDLHRVIDWKTTGFSYIQMRFAYAIITAYSVIEELRLSINVNVSESKRSILENGEWDEKVLEDLINRLKKSDINVNHNLVWMIRGDETKIEKARPIKTSGQAVLSENDKNRCFIEIKDGYVNIPDAINYVSFLRSRISSHCVGDRIMELSVFDVANAQNLARRLILEKIGLWIN